MRQNRLTSSLETLYTQGRMHTHPQLVVSGSIAIDRIMNFSGHYKDLIHADKLHVLSVSVLLDKLEQTEGGTGANIAYNAALLGESPILLGSAGHDAETYLQKLAAAGVDVSQVHRSDLPTASFNGLTDADNNQVGGFYPGAMGDAANLSLERWRGQDVVVVIAAHDPAAMRSQVVQCRDYGLRLLYDPGQQVSNLGGEDLMAGVAAAEVLIVNDYEIEVLAKKTGRSAAQLKADTPLLITTLGEEGSVMEGNQVDQPLTIPAARPLQVADPTGAGDAYRAGFLYGYLRQWDLPTCGQLGATLASFVIEQHGTQRNISRAAIMQRYRDNFNQEITL